MASSSLVSSRAPSTGQPLLAAALAGLLCMTGCSKDDAPPASSDAGGSAAEAPHITSSKNVGVMTEEQFTTLCEERAGTVEVMPHCGGFATAQGFSYDTSTELLSEHTCRGANACGGWNCALTDADG